MDVLYIPQLDEIGTGGDGEGGGGGSGGVAARYRILRRVPEDGVVNLTDRAITRVDQISTQCFASCPALEDIWIPNKTIAQTQQVVPSGNIIAGSPQGRKRVRGLQQDRVARRRGKTDPLAGISPEGA